MIGLYDDAKKGVNDTVDRAKDSGIAFAERVAGLMNGTIKATPEEIAASRMCSGPTKQEDDEEAAKEQDDDPL